MREVSRAGGSRSGTWMATGGPVQLLWAKRCRQATARASKAFSLRKRRKETERNVTMNRNEIRECRGGGGGTDSLGDREKEQ